MQVSALFVCAIPEAEHGPPRSRRPVEKDPCLWIETRRWFTNRRGCRNCQPAIEIGFSGLSQSGEGIWKVTRSGSAEGYEHKGSPASDPCESGESERW